MVSLGSGLSLWDLGHGSISAPQFLLQNRRKDQTEQVSEVK